MLNLKSKSYAISSVSGYGKDGDPEMSFKCCYIVKVPDPEKTRTDKDGNVRPQFVEELRYQFIRLSDLGEKFKGKSKNEICQALLGKMLSFNTILDI